MFITFLIIIGLSVLILGHEAAHFFVAKWFGLKVDEFGFGFPPRIVAKKIGETEYSLNWIPFGGFVKIAGESGEPSLNLKDVKLDTFGEGKEHLTTREKRHFFYAQPAWKRSLIILAGVIANFVMGWLLVSLVLIIGTPTAVIIGDIEPHSPADVAGLKVGDILEGFSSSQQFIEFVNAHRGEQIELHLLRGNDTVKISATPRLTTGPNEGALGISLGDAGIPRQGVLQGLWMGLKNSFIIAWLTLVGFFALLGQLLFHHRLLDGVVGPVGIVSIAQQFGKSSMVYLLQIISLISINLAVVNLIPFPALDGGRFFMIIVEKLKGSPISKRTEGLINSIGFVFLIALMVVITAHDIVKGF